MSVFVGKTASQKGLSMIEMLLVMSVVVLIIGAAVGIRAAVGRNEAELRFLTEYQLLQSRMRAAFPVDSSTDAGEFDLLTNELAIERNLVPVRWVQTTGRSKTLQYSFLDGRVRPLELSGSNPWGQTGSSAFKLTIVKMPSDFCFSVLPAIMAMEGVVAIENDVIAYSPINPLTMSRGQFVSEACSADASVIQIDSI